MSLDLRRKQLELMRVEMARKELEFKIDERMDEIKRIQDNIKLQLDKEAELKKEIDQLK